MKGRIREDLVDEILNVLVADVMLNRHAYCPAQRLRAYRAE
jgi:hypothetical protein